MCVLGMDARMMMMNGECFTFCVRQKLLIGTCIVHSNHATMVRTCFIFVTNLINSDYTHSNSLLYDDQKSDTTDTVQTPFEHTLQSVNRDEINLMGARYRHGECKRKLFQRISIGVTVDAGAGDDDSFATLQSRERERKKNMQR